MSPHHLTQLNSGSRAGGFSMFELLIAVVVVAIGILGIASLQVVSLQQNRAALFRAEALQIGNDILDRRRANPGTIGAPINYAPVSLNDAPAANKNCIGALQNCTPQEMRDFDVAQWKCSILSIDGSGQPIDLCDDFGITGRLPSGKGSIAVDANGVHTIRIEWIEDSSGSVASIQLVSQM